MKDIKGYLSLVLHTHLPFVNHPENDNYIEEQWLYEAISETYIPLLTYFNKLVEEKVNFKITMSMTPTLLMILDNKEQQEKYIRYLNKHIELAGKEIERTKYTNNKEHELAKYYYDRYSNDLYLFKEVYNCNLILQFKTLQDFGVIEIITCCATHGYIPMLFKTEKNMEVQIKYGVETYRRYFNKNPRGIWLAECGYVPEIEEYLKKYGIEYFLTEMHGVIYANPVPIYGAFAPIVSPNGICAFARNVGSTMKIWSNATGYPGDSNYREFNRDLGYDADYEYIKPYITYDGVRIQTGIKYFSVSGKQDNKEYYDLIRAKHTAETHAYDYMITTIELIKRAKSLMNGKKPIVVSAQDAELYGHWWYEGPYFLYILIKKIFYDQEDIDFITPGEYIDKFPDVQLSSPAISSWGAGGSNGQWMRCSQLDIYIHLEETAKRMSKIAEQYKNEKSKLKIRVLNQCARELLLLQSSDWYFNLTCGRVQEYSIERINMHISRFNELYNQLIKDEIQEAYLEEIEWKDCIFPYIDYRDF